MGKLSGKICMVTGAASGIGLGIARRFAEEDGHVILVDLNEIGLKSAAAEFDKAGWRSEYYACDVSSEEQISELFMGIEEKHGFLHVLNTNTWWSPHKNVLETTLNDWNKTMAVTLTAPFLFSKLAIPFMIKAGGGSIIHTSSVGGLIALRYKAAYVTAKAGSFSSANRLLLILERREFAATPYVLALLRPLLQQRT